AEDGIRDDLVTGVQTCALPIFTSEGKISIKQARYAGDEAPLDSNCSCRVCQRYSRAYLRHLYAANEVLAQVLNTVHNLTFYLDRSEERRVGKECRCRWYRSH